MMYMVAVPAHGVFRFRLQDEALSLFMKHEHPDCRLYSGTCWADRVLLLSWPPTSAGTKTVVIPSPAGVRVF